MLRDKKTMAANEMATIVLYLFVLFLLLGHWRIFKNQLIVQ
ncbi:hypothetical protein IGK14_001518 [Enterococcus sp. DIV0970a]|nr:hypothetical protein UAM_00986 [Enterococcus casseliflavus ATCC 49996]EOU11058.1 hypothetical protein I582_01572 [Enterococcus casseliflavus ATCC 49996]